MPKSFTGVDEVVNAVGTSLGETEWLEITQEQVNQFAEATGDHQWIHVDVERAAKGPYGGTIAHGYLTLSLIARFGDELFSISGVTAKLNYGVNKVRFPTPVPVGARVRAGASIANTAETPAGVQVSLNWVIELENSTKPACVAETVVLLVP
ncbi:MaoC family dehydratase [Kribbella albertanoniae]|uniref:MaoC family dehydratase n=1 Tax=Kribbella albertanoniae TaxID=1266829 RepID=A0A4R4Q7J8_9ACTN|nr:MaoC family dehydratase [Kribbella albertanoniae]TDC31130.1 MaoC family dehydratase [Kribbella albertanoniae]